MKEKVMSVCVCVCVCAREREGRSYLFPTQIFIFVVEHFIQDNLIFFSFLTLSNTKLFIFVLFVTNPVQHFSISFFPTQHFYFLFFPDLTFSYFCSIFYPTQHSFIFRTQNFSFFVQFFVQPNTTQPHIFYF